MYDRMQELYQFSHCSEPFFSHMEFCKNQQKFDERLNALFTRSGNGFDDEHRWTFIGSVFFVNSLVTTIGYGSMYPRTPGGMIFTLVFGILGIPVMAYTLRLLATMIIDTLQPLIADRSTSWYSGQSLTTGLLGGVFIFGGALVYVILGLGTVSAAIKMFMAACESQTEPLVSKLGDSYSTFVADCDCCTGSDRTQGERRV